MSHSILVAEDDPTLLLTHIALLGTLGEGYTFFEAKNGLEALEIAKQHKPNLILADWVMPGLSGLELVRQLKADPDTKDIPVIMVTSLISPTDLEMAFDEGAVDYLRKPVERLELISRVKSALRTHGYIQQISQQQLELAQNKQDLQELNTIKNIFFTIISGDLNEPLNSLTAFVNLLIKNINNFSKEEMKFVAENIRSSLHGISSLLKNLIQWSRSDQQITADLESVVLKPVLENIFLHNENGFSRKSVRIELNIEENFSLWVQKEIFLAVLQVFAESSSRFIAKNGEVHISISKEPDHLAIVFRMIGFKITPEQFESLFELDFYHHNDLTYFEKGSGLGYVISQNLLKKLNGHITTSVHGKDDVLFQLIFPNSSVA